MTFRGSQNVRANRKLTKQADSSGGLRTIASYVPFVLQAMLLKLPSRGFVSLKFKAQKIERGTSAALIDSNFPLRIRRYLQDRQSVQRQDATTGE